MDPDGKHVWAVIRCDADAPERFGNECLDSDLDPIIKFDLNGNVVESLGSGLFIWPHIELPKDKPAAQQERAYTSPIWYTPGN